MSRFLTCIFFLADDGVVSASLISLLKSYGEKVEGFKERVGDNFARGHNEATGGIIRRVSRKASVRLGHY